jgi:hypothetical protein
MSNNSFVERTKRFQLSNGVTLLVLENPANPTVSLAGSMRAGEYFSPAGKDSLAGITASMLGKGTRRRSKLEIAEETGIGGRARRPLLEHLHRLGQRPLAQPRPADDRLDAGRRVARACVPVGRA